MNHRDGRSGGELVARLREYDVPTARELREFADRIEELENELADQGNDWFKEECRLKDRIEELERALRQIADSEDSAASDAALNRAARELARAVLEKGKQPSAAGACSFCETLKPLTRRLIRGRDGAAICFDCALIASACFEKKEGTLS